jgi:hypothetical protein
MAKSTVKIKHLGVWSTAKFASIFCFLFSIMFLLVWGAIVGIMLLLSTVLGALMGGTNALIGTLLASGFGLVTFLLMAVAFVIIYTIMGFIVGAIGAFVFNIVAKFSGGLSFDAEIA